MQEPLELGPAPYVLVRCVGRHVVSRSVQELLKFKMRWGRSYEVGAGRGTPRRAIAARRPASGPQAPPRSAWPLAGGRQQGSQWN